MTGQRLTRLAPAKINLGLEVIGRRSDGYHDIATIMQTVSLFDTISVEPAETLTLSTDLQGVDDAGNLVLTAARDLATRLDREPNVRIELQKGIPVASGLGGASSDAATTLQLLSELWSSHLPEDALNEVAAQLGSDVPFFLHGGTAFVSGRGERMQPLTNLSPCWFVIATPVVDIERKTATLYGQLQAGDFSSGAAIAGLAGLIDAGQLPEVERLTNSFCRPLYELRPKLRAIPDAFRDAGAPGVALSGAGPSHFTLVLQRKDAEQIAGRLRQRLGATATVYVAARHVP